MKNKFVLIFRRSRKIIREPETKITRETGITQETELIQETETPEPGTELIRAVTTLAILEIQEAIPGIQEAIQEAAIPGILAMEIPDIRI